ncbi:MAG: response regulator [Verrucomicrobiota bacterium]|nr:response regulator [Verrucomicrobiota bacterium]
MKKILVIDDDPDILTVVRYALSALPGIEVITALSGQEGIGKAKEKRPDFILLDVRMPSMDGIATYEALQKIPDCKQTPVCFLTAGVQEKELQEYQAMGVKCIITKPFDAKALPQEVQRLWELYSTNS